MTRIPSVVSTKQRTCTLSPKRPTATTRVSPYSLRLSVEKSAESKEKSTALSNESPRRRSLRSLLARSKVTRTVQIVCTNRFEVCRVGSIVRLRIPRRSRPRGRRLAQRQAVQHVGHHRQPRRIAVLLLQ